MPGTLKLAFDLSGKRQKMATEIQWVGEGVVLMATSEVHGGGAHIVAFQAILNFWERHAQTKANV
jgi:hypothetical protein